MRRQVRMQPCAQQRRKIGGHLDVFTPGSKGSVVAVDAAVVDLGQWLE